MTTTPFIHDHAIIEPGATIGAGTRVWAFAHVLPGAIIGEDCNICDQVFIENQVKIGNRVTIKSGVQLWDGIVLEDDVFVGPNATFSNDHFPRSKQYPTEFTPTVIHRGASLGANATVLPGLSIGAKAVVGAGAVVTRDVPPNAIVTGNPARIMGYVAAQDKMTLQTRPVASSSDELSVRAAKLLEFNQVIDLRGSLSVGEFPNDLPFLPKRFFVVFEVSTKEVRGEHAHREQSQVLVCLNGSCSVVVDDGEHRDEVLLNRPNLGLYIPPMIWATQYKFTANAILLVLASDVYMSNDYIRDYDEYLQLIHEENLP